MRLVPSRDEEEQRRVSFLPMTTSEDWIGGVGWEEGRDRSPHSAQRALASGSSALDIGCWQLPPPVLPSTGTTDPQAQIHTRSWGGCDWGGAGQAGIKPVQSFKSLFAFLSLLNYKCPRQRLLHSMGCLNSYSFQAFILSWSTEMPGGRNGCLRTFLVATVQLTLSGSGTPPLPALLHWLSSHLQWPP